MALQLLAWDDTNKRTKRTTIDSTTIVATRAQRVALTNGTTSVSVSFSTAMANANYALVCTMQNTTDTTPLIQPVVVTYQDASGFVVKWNAPLDTANFTLNYMASSFL